jgi:hypothetical protein
MKYRLTFLAGVLACFFGSLLAGCDQLINYSEHQVVFEDNLYLQGTTSSEGFVNLMDYQFWRDNKSRIHEITEVRIEYRVTRNDSPTDIEAFFFFGESFPDIYLGSAALRQGQTTSSLVTLSLLPSQSQLIDLILKKDAFWYSVQGNSDTADVDFEPVRVTISGTFDIP